MKASEIIERAQRWRARRDYYRQRGESFDPGQFGVEPIEESTARAFVVQHHYSASYPAARARHGLFQVSRSSRAELVGVAVYSVPMSEKVIPRWLGVDPARGVELGRFVLLDTVPYNAESWFHARSSRLLPGELRGVEGVVAFSDPVPRVAASTGEIVLPGHAGTIYQARGGRFLGRSTPRTRIIDAHGREINDRMIQKAREGTGYAVDALALASLVSPGSREAPGDFVRRAMASPLLRRVRHPGNLAYCWDLSGNLDLPASQPYPKARDVVK